MCIIFHTAPRSMKHKQKIILGAIGVITFFIILGHSGSTKPLVQGANTSITPTATATPTQQPTPTQKPTNTPVPTATNTPVPTATPTPKPVYIAPTATNTPVPPATNSTATQSNNGTYKNVDGIQVQSPVHADSAPAGASAQCGDGTYSFSLHRSGTCSHHGGVAVWL